eukprot:GSMAST32.ASY1.ANO1.430.1 assembled CDS
MLPYVVATIVRLALVVFADWQDNNMAVKYTDIDYKVYTDAAIFVQKGGSPYDRTTYRYSPILAWMMLPNIMLVGLPRKEVSFWVCSWLFNPLVINMSTRGSADSIVGVLILLTLYLLLCEKVLFASIAYGTVVHFRVYPAVYCLALFEKLWMGIFSTYFKALQQQLIFAVGTAITFFSLGYTMYYIYGFQFVNDAFLHHFSRADTRHNFSISFETNDTDMVTNSITSRVLMGLLSFIPQLSVLTVLGISMCFTCFCITIAFVAFNKVCTAQYFLWYTILAPITLPFSKLSFFKKQQKIKQTKKNKKNKQTKSFILFILWLLSEWNWLFWAYQLEFKGKNTFLPIWFSGLIFFAAQILLLIELIRNHRGAKLKKE